MTNVLRTLCALALCVALTPLSTAQKLDDHAAPAEGGGACTGAEDISQPINTGPLFFAAGLPIGQSFTAPCDGVVVSIATELDVLVPDSVVIELFDGAGDGGTLLATETVLVNSNGLKTFTFATPVPVVSGGVYTYKQTTAGVFFAGQDAGDPYSGGDQYLTSSGSLIANPGSDQAFAVDFEAGGGAADCGTDTFGYACTDSDSDTPPDFDFKDISQTGTPLGLGDDDGAFVPLSFSFPFYGVVYDSVGVSSNGYLTFDTTDLTPSDLSNDPIPSANTPNALIAALWDDLDPACATATGCEIYYQDLGDKFVVQYDSIPHFPDSALEYNTFQVVLDRDGDIRMSYPLFTDDASNANSYTVGIENADGTDGIQAAFNGTPLDYLRSGFAVCFDYPGSDPGCEKTPPPPMCSLSFDGDLTVSADTVEAGDRFTFSGVVNNDSTGTKLAKLVFSYARQGGGPSGMVMYPGSGSALAAPGANPFSVRQRTPGNGIPGTYDLTFDIVNAATGEVCDSFSKTGVLTNSGGGTRWAGSALFDGTDYTATGLFAPDALISEASVTVSTEARVAPNPFSGETRIVFATEAPADVRLAVYDVLGREVMVLVDGVLEAGAHAATFNGRSLAAGTYLYRLSVDDAVQTGRMTLTR